MKRFSSLAWVLALALTGCGSEDTPEDREPPGRAVLAESTRVLDAEGLAALESFGPDGQLVFSKQSPVLDAISAGDVLIVGVSPATPNGALVSVEGVERTASGLVLRSRRAALEEAFEELHLDYDTKLTVRRPDALRSLGPLQATREEQGLAFPLRLEESGAQGRVVLEGAVSLAPSIDLNIDIDIVQFKLSELSLSFGAKETFSANLTAEGSVAFDESTTLASFSFTPIILTLPTPLGAVPLVFTPALALEAGVQGSVQGNVQAGVVQSASLEVGLGYRNGSFGPFSEHDSTFSAEDPTYAASANAKAFAGPRFEVLLYGLVGPFAKAQAYVELSASAEGPPPCARGTVDAGLTASVGVDFIAEYEATLFNASSELAAFDSCTNDPNAPRPAATWARSFSRSGGQGERAKAVTQLSDGTYLVVGDSSLFDGVTGFGASLWALRVDALGNVMWQRAFRGLTEIGRPQAVAQVPGGFLVLGNSGLVQLDVGGNAVWAKSYDTGQYTDLWTLAAHADGTSVVAGQRGDPGQAFAMGLDAQGNVRWARGYGGNEFSRVRITADGGSVAVGQTDSNYGDLYLVKLDTGGNVTWKRAIDNAYDGSGTGDVPPGSALDNGYDVVEKPNGGYIAVGETYGGFPIPEPSQAGHFAAWSVDLASDGALAGGSTVYRAPAEADFTIAHAVAVRPDGSSLIVGRRSDDVSSDEDILLIQGGTFSVLGGAGNDAILSGVLQGRAAPLQITRDGGAILAGTTTSFGGQEQVWLVKLSRTGNINFPYRSTLPGVSYVNEHARSVSVSSGATDVVVSVADVPFPLASEVTPVAVLQQSP